jgi:crossover junction endodeoxyribonuclease RuvC
MMKNKKYIGIDGGLDGAISVIENDKVLDIIIMPIIHSTKSKREFDILKIIDFLKKYNNATVILEKAHAMPQIGTVQAFNFGKSFGILLGILSSLNMRYHIVHAKRWQKEIFTDISNKDTKQSSIIVCKRLYPKINLIPTPRSKKEHHGMSDSLLLATWGQRSNI